MGSGGDPRLLTIPEAAVELRIHPNTAYRLVKAGSTRFPAAIKVGGQWRVPQYQLDLFITGSPSLCVLITPESA